MGALEQSPFEIALKIIVEQFAFLIENPVPLLDKFHDASDALCIEQESEELNAGMHLSGRSETVDDLAHLLDRKLANLLAIEWIVGVVWNHASLIAFRRYYCKLVNWSGDCA